MNWKYILIIFILAVLVGGGVLAYQYWWVPKEAAKISEIKSPEVKAPEDETADWKTYRNEEYGFELNYDANKYKIENDTYGWPYAIVLFSKFGAGQSYYLAIEVWDNESAFNSIRGYIVPNPPVVKKIGNKYITLWNISQDEGIDQVISTFKPTTQPEKTSHSTNESLSIGNCIIREERESFFMPPSNDPDNFRFDIFSFKFKEGLDARLRNGKFVSLCGADFSSLNKILSENPKWIPKRLFSRSEEELEQEYKTAKLNDPGVADLNLWYNLQWDGNTDHQKLLNLMSLIKQFLFIEGVGAVAIAEPASLP